MGARRQQEQEDLAERIGRILTTQMLGAGLNPAELQRRTGVPQSTISRILSGKNEARVSQLIPLAHALGMTLDQAVGAETPPPLLLRPRDQRVVAAYYADEDVRRVVNRLLPEE